MQNDRFPRAGEVDVPIPMLGAGFRRGVLLRARLERRQRRVRIAALGLTAAVGAALFVASSLGVRSGRGTTSTHWSRALDEDLAWLEESRSRFSEGADSRGAEVAPSTEAPLDYFFPNYQAAASNERQLTLR
jgi:hypothetical protein